MPTIVTQELAVRAVIASVADNDTMLLKANSAGKLYTPVYIGTGLEKYTTGGKDYLRLIGTGSLTNTYIPYWNGTGWSNSLFTVDDTATISLRGDTNPTLYLRESTGGTAYAIFQGAASAGYVGSSGSRPFKMGANGSIAITIETTQIVNVGAAIYTANKLNVLDNASISSTTSAELDICYTVGGVVTKQLGLVCSGVGAMIGTTNNIPLLLLANWGTAITLSTSQLIQFNSYTTAGYLKNDTSGNITTGTDMASITGLTSGYLPYFNGTNLANSLARINGSSQLEFLYGTNVEATIASNCLIVKNKLLLGFTSDPGGPNILWFRNAAGCNATFETQNADTRPIFAMIGSPSTNGYQYGSFTFYDYNGGGYNTMGVLSWIKTNNSNSYSACKFQVASNLSVNTALYIEYNGNVSLGRGDTAAVAKFDVLCTTEQARFLYDTSNYVSHTVASNGYYTIASTSGYYKFTATGNMGVYYQPGSNDYYAQFHIGDGSTWGWSIVKDVGSGTYGGPYGLFFYERNSGSAGSRLALNSGGNLGIGIVVASQKLDVYGYCNLLNGLVRTGTSAVDAHVRGFNALVAASGCALQLGANNSVTTGIYIDTAGNIGIGITTLSYKLHVYGGILASVNAGQAGFFETTVAVTPSVVVYGHDSNNTFGGSASIYVANVDSAAFGRHQSLILGTAGISGIYAAYSGGYRAAHHLAFYTKNATTDSVSVERARIDQDGKFGIGVSAINEKLEVLGNIRVDYSGDAADNTVLSTDTNGYCTITPSGSKLYSSNNFYSTAGDVVTVANGKGMVQKDSANSHYWRIVIDSSGNLSTSDLGTSPP
jgi:hypothetical protein